MTYGSPLDEPVVVELPDGVQDRDAFSTAANVILMIAAIAGFIAFQNDRRALPILAFVLYGCAELDNRCGASHISTFTPLRALGNNLWARALLSYSSFGLITATIIGSAMGTLGLLAPSPLSSAAVICSGLVACLIIIREIGWIRFPIPQVRRQTFKHWAFDHGLMFGAGMWGAHIGIGFLTVIRHGGFYVLCLYAATLGPSLAALMLISYWLGRIVPLWTAPLFLRESGKDGVRISAMLASFDGPCRRVAIAASACFLIGAHKTLASAFWFFE